MLPHGMCYSNFGNIFQNGAISIAQRDFINDYYKVNAIGQWGKTKVTVMGFALTVAKQRFFSYRMKKTQMQKLESV